MGFIVCKVPLVEASVSGPHRESGYLLPESGGLHGAPPGVEGVASTEAGLTPSMRPPILGCPGATAQLPSS